MVGDFLYRITEPVLRPIRSVMPDLGGIDISPVVLILIIILIKRRDRSLYIYSDRALSRAGWPRPWAAAPRRARGCRCG